VVLGKHNFKARYLGERMARELGNALVAPVMPFAPTSGELMKFPGTIDLSVEIFSRVNEEVTASLVKAGFKYVILMGDHGGNQDPLQELAPRLDAPHRPQGVVWRRVRRKAACRFGFAVTPGSSTCRIRASP